MSDNSTKQTKFPGSLDVYVVNAGAEANNHPQGLELLEIVARQRDVMVQQSSHRFIQYL